MDAVSADWIGIYKLARLAFVACALLGIALHLLRRPELEAAAQRMLEDDES
jgi:hypothetical protein